MTRAAWTSGALSAAELKELAEDLSKIPLPYTATTQEVFVRLVDEAIAEFRELRQPVQQDLLDRKERLKQVAAASKKLAVAIADLDGDSEDLIELHVWAAEGKDSDIPYGMVRQAASVTARLEAGARHWIKHPGEAHHRTKVALDGFIGELGRAYLAAFHERPSPSLNGPFAKSLPAIFRSAGIPVRVGEPPNKGDPATDENGEDLPAISRTRLDRIIRERVLGGPQLRPGRKSVLK